MSALIFKSRGKCWRFCALDMSTGELLGEVQSLPALTRRLWRAGWRLSFALARPKS